MKFCTILLFILVLCLPLLSAEAGNKPCKVVGIYYQNNEGITDDRFSPNLDSKTTIVVRECIFTKMICIITTTHTGKTKNYSSAHTSTSCHLIPPPIPPE